MNTRPSEHWMHESQVDAYIKATLELHYQPGVNPYVEDAIKRGVETDPNRSPVTSVVWEIQTFKFNPVVSNCFDRIENGTPFQARWWSTPGLGFTGGTGRDGRMTDADMQKHGALIADTFLAKRVWAHPDLLKLEQKQQEEEDRISGQWDVR